MRIVTDPPRQPEGAVIAQVSYADASGFGVVGASRISGAFTFAPRGIAYMPSVGDNLLLLPAQGRDTCIGALTSTAGLRPGELRLFSSGGASILLAANGEIHLNGALITRDGRVISR